jgi:hypothetical protein
VAVRSAPTSSVPLIDGGKEFRGGIGAVGAATTTDVGAELASLEPATLLAVTRKRRVEPTSAEVSWCSCAAAPPIAVHPVPLASHLSHWYPKVSGVVPDQVPLEPVSPSPSVALPETTGVAVFAGGVGADGAETTTGERPEVADLDPDEFVAVATMRIAEPTSASSTK